MLAWRVCGRTTSNAIAVVTNGQAVGVGAGQQSRVVAAEIAVQKAGERAKGGAGASDAFFPFPDGLLVLADAGVTAVVQPGGSVQRRRGHRRRRRGRPGHGHDRRAALPALMGAILLDGEAVAARIRAEVADRVARLRRRGRRRRPRHRARRRRRAERALRGAEARGLRRRRHVLGGRAPARHAPPRPRCMDVIARFNADPAVSAFLVQLPLPAGLDEERALLAVDPDKDVDGLHPVNLGRLVLGTPGPLPCTPSGIVELLHAYDVPVEGRHVVIIGRGVTIGRPLANLLAAEAPGLQRRGDRGAHRRRPRTWPRSCARPTSSWPPPAGPHLLTPGHGQARRRRGVGRHDLRGQEADPRRAPGRGRGGRVDHAPPGRGGPHDPCHAVAQRGAGRGDGGP